MARSGVVFVASDFILDHVLDEISGHLREAGYEVIQGPRQVPPIKTEFAREEWQRYFGRTDVIVTTTRSILPRELLAAAPRLRGVVFPTIGTESIDLQAANELGIPIGHGPTPENFNSMAESTVLLMLALMYDLHGTERVLRENAPRPTAMKAHLLMGKTVGLIGCGRIARGVAQRLAGWGVKVVAFDPYLPGEQVPASVKLVAMETLLATSDIVSLHATLTPGTRQMIGADQFALMKRNAFFVNTARGGMVDEQALCHALQTRRIAGAALDAFEQEPLPGDHPLRMLDNVILTPHMVGHTQEIFDAMPPTALENISRLMEGEAPLYCLNPAALPTWRSRLDAFAGSA